MLVPLPPESRTKDNFKIVGNAPAAWFMSADRLLAGARVLMRELQPPNMDLPIGSPVPQDEKLMPAAFLLYGFAIENLLKARWLKQGNTFVGDEKFCGIQGVNGHDLPNLARVTNFSVSEREKFVLQGLFVKMISSARYPVGMEWSKGRPVRLPNGGFSSHTTFNGGDVEVIESIANRIISDLGYTG